MKKFLKEPLVHFLLLGFLLFGFYYFINQKNETKESILIDNTEYNYLLSSWKKQWQRNPNQEEIKAFLNQYIRQEVFYKEALNLNLDHNDIIIKRRLSQKMEAVSNDLSAMIKPPTDKELKAFYLANPKIFKVFEAYSFQQVLFLDDEVNMMQTIQQTLTSLKNGVAIPEARINKLSIPNKWQNAYGNDLNNSFGGDFAKALHSLPINQWVGPISSGYGQHLIYITEKKDAGIANFDEIKPFVQKEFEYQNELNTQEKVYQDLLKKYSVDITAENIPSNVKKTYNH